MNVTAQFLLDTQAADAAERAFDDKAPFPEAFVRFDNALGDAHRDAAFMQPCEMKLLPNGREQIKTDFLQF